MKKNNRENEIKEEIETMKEALSGLRSETKKTALKAKIKELEKNLKATPSKTEKAPSKVEKTEKTKETKTKKEAKEPVKKETKAKENKNDRKRDVLNEEQKTLIARMNKYLKAFGPVKAPKANEGRIVIYSPKVPSSKSPDLVLQGVSLQGPKAVKAALALIDEIKAENPLPKGLRMEAYDPESEQYFY